MNNKEVLQKIDSFLKKGYLISPDFFNNQNINEINEDIFYIIENKLKEKEKPLVVNNDFINFLKNGDYISDINWKEFEKSRVLMEIGKDPRIYNTFLDLLSYNISEEKKQTLSSLLKEIKEPDQEINENIILDYEKKPDDFNVIILKSYEVPPKKREAQDFVYYYNNRYEALKKILLNRTELQNTISINRLLNKNNREEVSIIGMINEITISKNDNIILTIEDVTGHINILINKNRKDIYEKAKKITFDEVIGVVGLISNKMVFTNDIFFPDVIINKKIKKFDNEVYAAFISDIHVGSRLFLRKEFLNFISWLNGEYGSPKQREISKKVKYLFIVGDLIDGVGVYPSQESELEILDVYDQYKECANLLKKIRSDIKIIACGGQHDALRLSEPQPPLDKGYAKSLYEIKNFMSVSNPALVNINSTKDFEGFNILVYHGASFHYYIANIDSLRFNDSYKNPHYVLHFLIQKRHLAPTHASTVYVPDIKEDHLVIDRLPDIVVCGDMHRSDISQYNNIITINCSCWQSKTDFQEKTGNNPDPTKVPIFNLMTREIKILKFGD